MPVRSGLGVLVAAACALGLLAGCPAPTGRMRGPTSFDAAAFNCDASSPVSGDPCTVPQAVCVAQIPCGLAPAVMNNTCVCSINGTWSCVLGPCSEPPVDVTEPVCPSTPVADHSPCTARQGGLSCPGVGADCDGGPVDAPCWCTGTQWSCQQPVCARDGGTDGGADDVDEGDVITMCPAAPPAGLPCHFGLMCIYDDACTTGCICGFDRRFVCTVLGCDAGFDAARPDASLDATRD